ncbi:DUF1232 domain-containing protein [Caldimonas thermodepolymerans]|jgi:Uncharacterized conserved protein|uniref:DUF1232 domain-containing protein n=1 Tax=Caldimonas thermodepolymerans TaxID=215580 RepID=A0A2S5T8Y8_9BURK|nr:YkvA family protein [Caldimonas thermodepolymerans]PPE71392.1 DUF1232 domain-containing protein [Caldimonas thermodepolymerans]QPC32567.1 DUF1232 domain-containing protein [Caldimonas thermodepolymerans]RDH98965.1 uncharacterized membrane protein YkvA (DUF1232 family) [Caldimonas thermodepolymerans]TCP06364.1 uncharacterized membrane protein YkvA (DUF1232 family) [Caldimonas thermodepolymerans]UZG45369.1 YkvA family protein [Caldimonas thermodepolymerans]
MKLTKLVRAAHTARLATHLIALWKLFRDRRMPRAARLVAIVVLAYAVSPIDLIPDFIPVLGQLDDLVLIPLGIALVAKLVPQPAWQQLLREAEVSREKLPRLLWGAALVVLLWLVMLGLFVWWLLGGSGA